MTKEEEFGQKGFRQRGRYFELRSSTGKSDRKCQRKREVGTSKELSLAR